MSHLVAMDNPWRIVDVGSIVQWDFDLVQCRPWEARGRDDILIPSDFLDNCIDEGRFPLRWSHPPHRRHGLCGTAQSFPSSP